MAWFGFGKNCYQREQLDEKETQRISEESLNLNDVTETSASNTHDAAIPNAHIKSERVNKGQPPKKPGISITTEIVKRVDKLLDHKTLKVNSFAFWKQHKY